MNEVNSVRFKSAREDLGRKKIDVLVLQLPENVLFLGGYWPMMGLTCLLFPAEGRPVCIAPGCYEKEAARELWDAELVMYEYGLASSPDQRQELTGIISEVAAKRKWKKIGYEGAAGSMAVSWNSAEVFLPAMFMKEYLETNFGDHSVVDAVPLLESWKLVKTPWEIERIRHASVISCIGLEAFERAAVPGVSGVEITAEVEKAVMTGGTGTGGACRVRAFAQTATGAAETSIGYRPNEISTLRRLEKGDLALLELGVVVDGYWADRTRVRAAGGSSPEQREIFDIVKKAREAAVSAVKPGISAEEVDEAARQVIREAGFEKAFPHITGHGVGFAYHESAPGISPGNSMKLSAGMIHSIEPGIYLPSVGGIRLEDDILVTPGGAEILGPYPKKLD